MVNTSTIKNLEHQQMQFFTFYKALNFQLSRNNAGLTTFFEKIRVYWLTGKVSHKTGFLFKFPNIVL